MRFSKALKLGFISIATVMLLCSCKGNDAVKMLESNSVALEQQKTDSEEKTTVDDTVETTTEIAEEETTLQDSVSEESSTEEVVSEESTTEESTTKESTTENITTKKPVDKTTTQATTTKKKVDKTTAQQTTTKKKVDKTTMATTKKSTTQSTTSKKEETTTVQQTTVQQTTQSPTTQKPTQQTTTAQPTTQKPTQQTTTAQPTTEQQTTAEPQKEIYTVVVGSQGGLALEGVEVYIYSDSSHSNMLQSGTTDYYGSVQFELTKSDKYSVVLGTVPTGYQVADGYSFSGTSTLILLNSSVVKGEFPTLLTVGDVMYDYTVTAPDGTTYTISEVLKEKNMVILNFWYANCPYCIMEFPYINEAYLSYKDDIEVLAVDPYDSMTSIEYVKTNNNLSFPMTSCDQSLASVFGVTGYPTTVVIDKYGTIWMVEPGARTNLTYWENLFSAFAD